MQRYFCNLIKDSEYLLSNDDSYHIQKVMRMKLDDQIEIVDNREVYLCKITSFNPVKAKVVERIKENHENSKKIIFVQSMVNENKMDYLLQKGTELGMEEFYALKVKNCVVKENDKTNKKIVRWQKIVKEASEQAKRNIIPTVHEIIDIQGLCAIKADLKILLSVNENEKNMKKVLKDSLKCDTLMIVVGPEGGFTDDEEKKLIASGFIRTSLGGRVLRSETAGMVAISMINYEWMV